MMHLVYHPNKILREKCQEINLETTDILELEDIGRQMLKIMYNNNGVGLAHTQVGGNLRLFVMGNEDSNRVLINPTIEKQSREVVRDIEGCLSFPNLWIPVLRPRTILAKWNKPDGSVVQEFFSDFEARCFLHEIDHLDGICFDTRVSKLVLNMAKKKQRKKNKHV